VSCSLNCLSLSDNDISDLSAFTKLEKITLIDCLEVKNISCLRQVSYLNFSGSFHIEDFSCLSSEYQKFVNLSRCKIQDNDALTLGNIPFFVFYKLIIHISVCCCCCCSLLILYSKSTNCTTAPASCSLPTIVPVLKEDWLPSSELVFSSIVG
jgi:Leucine-rich repeat (LRR) protein